MKKITREIALALSSAGLALTATIVTAQDIQLAVMPAGMDTFGTAVGRGFSAEAETLGFTPIVIDSQWSAENQANAIDDLLLQGVNGIGLLPIDSVASMAWVDRLVEAGVPVVSAASSVGDPARIGQTEVYEGLSAFVNLDEIALAARIGTLAAGLLPTDGSAQVAIVQGAPGYATNDYRRQGFIEGLDAAGVAYTIVADQPTDWSVERGEAVCQNILTANPDVDVIFTTADPMAVGCANAVTSMGASAKIVGTAGGMQIGIDAIAAGAMHASVCFKPETMGRIVAQTLFAEATAPGTHAGEFIAYDAPVVTAENLGDCIPEW